MSFKKGQRVLYMGDHTWAMGTIEKHSGLFDIVLKLDDGYLPCVAPISRCTFLPDHVKTVEQVVYMLRHAENWDDKS
jgi:hypothetical protein